MKSVTEIAILQHDQDADYFQTVYSKLPGTLTKKEVTFLAGRKFVLDELEILLKSLPKGSRVLDIGCGTAHLSNWIKEKGFNVYGVEPSNEMYIYAAKNFPDIEIKKGISSNLPYSDNSFDLVVAFEVLRYLDKEENEKTYFEMHRVLKKEGRFFITQVNMFSTDLYYFFHRIKHFYFKRINKLHPYCNFTTTKAEKKLAKNAGFENVQTIGVYAGTIRLAYKFGVLAGNIYSRLYKKIDPTQIRRQSILKNLSAHLIVTGIK